MGVVAETADRVIILRDGRMVEQNEIRELFRAPQQPYTRELLPRCRASAASSGRLRGTAPTRRRRCWLRRARRALRSARRNLRLGPSRVHAVEGISFEIGRRETFSLVGESGCGKSTTAKAIAGLVPYGGNLVLDGRSMAGLDRRSRQELRRNVQMIFQDPYRLARSADDGRATSSASRSTFTTSARLRSAANGWRPCSTGSACRPTRCRAIRTNSQAGSASASASPGPLRFARSSLSPTRAFRRSTSRSKHACSIS